MHSPKENLSSEFRSLRTRLDSFQLAQLQSRTFRDQARGRLGRNSRPRGRNFALYGTQGEVGVSLKKKKIFFFKEDSLNASCGDIIRQSTTTASCLSFH